MLTVSIMLSILHIHTLIHTHNYIYIKILIIYAFKHTYIHMLCRARQSRLEAQSCLLKTFHLKPQNTKFVNYLRLLGSSKVYACQANSTGLIAGMYACMYVCMYWYVRVCVYICLSVCSVLYMHNHYKHTNLNIVSQVCICGFVEWTGGQECVFCLEWQHSLVWPSTGDRVGQGCMYVCVP